MDERYLTQLSSDIKLIQSDIKYIKEKFDTEKQHSERLARINSEKVNDHEKRIRNVEQLLYKGIGAAIVVSSVISWVISWVISKTT